MKRTLKLLGMVSILVTGSLMTLKASAATFQNGSVTIGVNGSLNGPVFPYLGTNPGMRMVINQQFATLLNRMPDLSLAPELVTKYWYANGGTKVYMQLSKTAVWSDGVPVTSQDVKLAVNFLASNYYNTVLQGTEGYRVTPIVGVNAVRSGSTSQVSGFHIVNSKEFYLQLTTPDATVVNEDLQGIMPLPSHLLANKSMSTWLNLPVIASASVGSGPYILNHSTLAEVSMKANPKFILGKPKLPQLNLIGVTPQSAQGLLEDGQIDLYSGLAPSQVAGLANSGLQILTTPSNEYTFLSFRDTRPGYFMPEFRQAVEYALNRTAIINAAVNGFGVLDNGPIPPSSFWYNQKLTGTYAYNPQLARDTLVKAGFHLGPTDWIVQPDGSPINPVIEYVQGDPYGQAEAQEIVKDLRYIAINAQLGPALSAQQMVTEMQTDSPQLTAFVMGWHLGVDPDPRGLWRSSDTFNLYTCNWTNTLNTAVSQSDQLIQQQATGSTAFSTSGRQTVLNTWQTLLNQQLPVDFLFTPDVIAAANKRLQNVVMSPLGPMNTWMWTESNPSATSSSVTS